MCLCGSVGSESVRLCQCVRGVRRTRGKATKTKPPPGLPVACSPHFSRLLWGRSFLICSATCSVQPNRRALKKPRQTASKPASQPSCPASPVRAGHCRSCQSAQSIPAKAMATRELVSQHSPLLSCFQGKSKGNQNKSRSRAFPSRPRQFYSTYGVRDIIFLTFFSTR